ncbi:hypothetical protein [Noviherbaspirillum pedocola]|uniref:Uncharacterized protein n=1 Tax=Noviherbaspirillum pedocola TaxID=2801341 RepID=A0A934W8P4_9BURK|nr:hypothetical protein [Noviherbaspirillum pedocola]MBK4737815.1 hypothetical protein [Noviherbaspirillum pedocola]
MPIPTQALPVLYYLFVPLLLTALIAAKLRSVFLFSLLAFIGTFVHECLHLGVGGLLRAKPVGMSILPKPGAEGKIELGSVSFANITWYNALPLAIAPLLGLPLAAAIAYWRVQDGWAFQWLDVPLWIALASLLLGCWPSRTDWKISLKSWPIYLGIAGFFAWPHLPFA